LNKADYRDYLRSTWWKNRRFQALNDVGRQCQLCNSEVDLQVHHLSYENLGNEKPKDLLISCEVCHKLTHDGNHRLYQAPAGQD